ncbi:MAG: phosphoribosyltransferase family protein [Chlamydiales bacterium]|nr:phosphoribosyltransferase family protein [Chlamydiales bacterium]
MLFVDREDAGKKLASLVQEYADQNVIVLGLPRGGVVTAYQIARSLNAPLDVTCPRKIGAPWNPELAIGAVSEAGEATFNEDLLAMFNIPEETLETAIERERAEARRRLLVYRSGKPPLVLDDKIVILVDDGLATGATMKAAIRGVQARNVKQVVVAVPVSPPGTLEEIQQLVNRAICLFAPPFFQAVGQFYQNFGQTSDEEVISLLNAKI